MSGAYGEVFSRWRMAAGEDWGRYVRHPFVEDIAEGTLPMESFLRYLVQDYVFLVHFSRAWALGVTKAETMDELRQCAATVDALVNHEMALHVQTCAEVGLSEEDLHGAEEHPANLAYTRYVLDAGHSGDFLDLMAALAPCVLGYGEIGARLVPGLREDHPYRGWIATYGGEAYQGLCHDVGALIDAAAARRLGDAAEASPRWERLSGRFRTATRLEQAFWQMGLSG